jgi:hypothetical protein
LHLCQVHPGWRANANERGKTKNVYEGNNAEKPKHEPTPVQRLVSWFFSSNVILVLNKAGHSSLEMLQQERVQIRLRKSLLP